MSNNANDRRPGAVAVFTWCTYDWAHSAFGTIVTTFIFAPYFIRAVAPDPNVGTVIWGQTLGLAALVAALASPVLGAIADRGGRRKPWIAIFTIGCALFSCSLFLVEPQADRLWPALVLFAAAAICSDLAWVFYNAILPSLVTRERLGRISGLAWSLGYFGGMASLIVSLFVFVRDDAPLAVLDEGGLENIRATTVLAGLWVLVFALPMLFLTPDRPGRGLPMTKAAISGMQALAGTVRQARRHRNLMWFLLSWLCASNGFTTLFAFAGVYAAGTFGMGSDEIILFAIAVNITAGIGAFAFGWVDDWIGPKRTILLALLAMTSLGIVLVLTESRAVLWSAGMLLGFFIGPAQSANRSFMARLVPPGMEAQMFGLYALSGKATAFAGPLVLALVTDLADSQRIGMATILVFFVLGLLFMIIVKEPSDPLTIETF